MSVEWRERIAGAWEVLRGRAWAKPFQEPAIVTEKGNPQGLGATMSFDRRETGLVSKTMRKIDGQREEASAWNESQYSIYIDDSLVTPGQKTLWTFIGNSGHSYELTKEECSYLAELLKK
jgi:hypothetical protein